MIALLSQLLAALVQALPRVFVLGAPILLTIIAIAALLDVKIPGTVNSDAGMSRILNKRP
jgi:hypothetical protein